MKKNSDVTYVTIVEKFITRFSIMKNFKKSFTLMLLVGATTVFTLFSCTVSDNVPNPNETSTTTGSVSTGNTGGNGNSGGTGTTGNTTVRTITTVVRENQDLSIFYQAMVRTGYDVTLNIPNDNRTLFAPTNAACTAALAGSTIDQVPIQTLKNIVAYHILDGKIKNLDLSSPARPFNYLKTVSVGAIGARLDMFSDAYTKPGKILINGSTNIISSDIEAQNGVIHIVDKLIPELSITSAIASNPTLSSFYSVLNNEGTSTLNLLNTASPSSPKTVFAPNSLSITNATSSWLVNLSLDQVKTIINYHVANGNIRSLSLTDRQSINTLAQKPITYYYSPGSTSNLRDEYGNYASFKFVDVQCSNGTLYGIDIVLRPNLY